MNTAAKPQYQECPAHFDTVLLTREEASCQLPRTEKCEACSSRRLGDSNKSVDCDRRID
jgi:hypothetical protein